MDLWDSCIEIAWERRPFPPCALRALNSCSISYVSCLCLWRFFISFVWSWSTRLVWFFELFDVILIPLVQCLTPRNHELFRIRVLVVFAFLLKPPLLVWFLSIPLNPWGLSLKSFGDVFLKSSSSSPQNLSSFGHELIDKSLRFPKDAGWKISFLGTVRFLPITG